MEYPDCVIFNANIMPLSVTESVFHEERGESQGGFWDWEVLLLDASTYAHARVCDALVRRDYPMHIMDSVLQINDFSQRFR